MPTTFSAEIMVAGRLRSRVARTSVLCFLFVVVTTPEQILAFLQPMRANRSFGRFTESPSATTITTIIDTVATSSRVQQSLHRLGMGSRNDVRGDYDGNDEDDSSNFMSVVRSLQDTFYTTDSSTPSCFLDWEDEQNRQSSSDEISRATGQVRNLPILTWPSHEVPGRANVLHVHEGVDTHMMETILRSNPPVWYVGMVYRDGKQTERQLQSWQNVFSKMIDPEDDTDNSNPVLGTLMRITDYRRTPDGRLLVLVQALERFVVEDVVQTAPYAVADVQLLPDCTTTDGASRLDTIRESFQKWQRYEFEHTMLPLPNLCNDGRRSNSEKNGDDEAYLDGSVGLALSQLVPFARYSSKANVERIVAEPLANEFKHSTIETSTSEVLEQELIGRGILSKPWLNKDLRFQNCNELEWELWVWVDKYLKETNRNVSPELLALLPPAERWPTSFSLEAIFNAMVNEQQNDDSRYHKHIARISPHYPALRRQQRLSYAAAALLEDSGRESETQSLRLKLLQIPSTQQRLAFVLQSFRQRAEGGAFQ